MERARLEVVGIETEIFAVCRSILASEAETPTTLLLQMGAETVTLAILANNELVFTQAINSGGLAITRAVASELGLDGPQAEEYKKSYGLDEGKLEGKVFNAVKPIMELIIGEVRRALAYYETHQQGSGPVKRVLLSGGTALIPGIVPYITNSLGLEALMGNPFAHVEASPAQRQFIGEESVIYSVATGLAMKKL